MNHCEILDHADTYWTPRGFVPWEHGGMAGVYRRMTLRKDSMLGEVARYYADDYIIWRHNGKPDQEMVYQTWRPIPEVMVQRAVFLSAAPESARRARAFCFGLRGYLEIYMYGLTAQAKAGMKDLAIMIEEAASIGGGAGAMSLAAGQGRYSGC